MTIKKLPPFDLKVGYEWMEPETAMGGEFAEDQYWLNEAKGAIEEASLLTTTRSSDIVLPDSAGVFQTLGNNVLPRTDRGLYVNGQYGLENYSSVDFSASSAWKQAPSFSLVAVPSVFSGQSAYRHTGNNAGSHGRDQNCILSSAGIIRISAIIEQVSATSFAIGISVRSPFSWIGLGIFTWSTGLITTGGGNIADPEVQNLGTGPNGGALRLITFTVDTGAVTDTTMWMYPNGVPANTDQTIVHYVGYQYPALPLQPPAISPNNAKFTTMASDIRAVQGTRPSNSQPEPFPGWEAAGLDGQYKKKFRVSVDWLDDAAERTISVIGVDAQNKMRLFLDTDNRIKGVLTKLGPELAPDTTPNLNIYRAPDVPIISYNSGSILIAGREYRISYVVSENVGNNSTNLYVGGAQVTAGRISGGVNGSFTVNAAVSVSPVNLAVSLSPAGNVVDLMLDTISIREAVEYVVLQSDPITVLGEYEIELDAVPESYALRVSDGIAGDTDPSTEMLPAGATTLRIGSDFGALNPFNGWIKNVQVLKVE